MLRFCLILFVAFGYSLLGYGQQKILLKTANTLRGSIQDGVRVDWIIGEVAFVQNKTTIYCDSAIFFRAKNFVEAYGHIKIVDGDSIVVTAHSLQYDGNTKIANLRQEVVFAKRQMVTLYTDYLDYDRQKNQAYFFNQGKLVDSTHTLTSEKGNYDLYTNMASFKTNVVGVSKKYTITADTLQYNTENKFVYFQSKTKIEDKSDGIAYYETGYYDTQKRKSLIANGEFQTARYVLKGASLFFDDAQKLYTATDRVVLTIKKEKIDIFGDKGIYNKATGIARVYGHAYMSKVTDDEDTLFIAADTLVSIDSNDPQKNQLLAYHHVRIFKKNLQGIADSLLYKNADSTLYFYGNPVLWTKENQMSADSIRILLKDKGIDRIVMKVNSFVITEDSLKNYNQIKGGKMTAFFDDKKLHHVHVEGNGESLYFALQQEEVIDGHPMNRVNLLGMNKIICSNMKIKVANGTMSEINFYVKPEASFIPPHELKKDDRTLKGFHWRTKDRPSRDQIIMRSSIK